MYGTPTNYYEIKGTVCDEDQNPVADADIILRHIDKGTVYTLPGDTVKTKYNGRYTMHRENRYSEDIRIVCKPKDDALEADSVNLSEIRPQGLEIKIDFHLKTKKQEK